MNVLLLSMPDSFEHMAPVAVRMPNGALTSIAGNVDPQHRVAVADLILVQGRVTATVDRLLAEHQPDVVGLSVMTFQRRTALRLIERIRRLRPAARIVVGGYDPSLASDAYESAVDFVVRGEGEITFRELLRALEQRRPASTTSPASATATASASATPPIGRSARSTRPPSRRRGATPACSAATRCSAGRSTSSRPRAAAPSTAASARSSRCAAATSTPTTSSASSTTSATAATAAPGRCSSSTTTSRST